MLLAALAVAAIGALIEIVVLRRIYSSPEIFQLLATFGVVLIVQDIALAIWGPTELFAPRAPGLKGSVEIAGAFVPQYSIFVMIAVGPAVYALLWWVITADALGRMGASRGAGSRDRGRARLERADALYVGVRAGRISGGPRGRAADSARDRQSANGSGSFDRSVRRGCRRRTGSVTGAFWAAMLIGLLHAFGSWWLPQSTLVLIFVVMAVVLIVASVRACWAAARRTAATRMHAHAPFTAPAGAGAWSGL